ncbi:MAG: hypothetical protein ACKOEM_21230 [Planctomycetia bacterium]
MPLVAALAVVSSSVLQSGVCHAQQPLGFRNVVVLQSGTGATSAATATSLQEFTPSGTPVQNIAMPSSGAGTKLTNVGSTSTEGTLAISPDGRWITFGGYDAVAGTANVVTGTATSRVAGLLNTTTGTYSLVPMGSGFRVSTGAAIRGVATNDGNSIWGIGSSQGLVYGTVSGGAGSFGTISSGLPTGYNAVGVFSGTSTNLYASNSQGSNPRVAPFGPNALPTGTATSFTALPGAPPTATTTSGFAFLDVNPLVPGLDTLYVTDVSQNATGGVYKYLLGSSGTWAGGQLISGTSGLLLRGLAAFVSGSDVRLFATSATSLFTYWDANAATSTTLAGPSTIWTTIATATTGVEFRGVTVVPEPSTAVLIGVGSVLGATEWVRRRRSRRRQP